MNRARKTSSGWKSAKRLVNNTGRYAKVLVASASVCCFESKKARFPNAIAPLNAASMIKPTSGPWAWKKVMKSPRGRETIALRPKWRRTRLAWHIREARVLALECNGDSSRGSISLLCENKVCLTSLGVVALEDSLAVKQNDDVGILLQRSGLTKVRELGTLVL